MAEEKKTEPGKDVTDLLKENYSQAVETTTKLQQQYFENVKKATDYLLSLQKTWVDTMGRLSTVSPDVLGKGVTAEAYRGLYDFWTSQFEVLSRLMGVPTIAPARGINEYTKDTAESFWKNIDVYNRTFAVWADIVRGNVKVVSENLAELQKASLGAYKGWLSLFSVSEEEREKILGWFTESIKKNLETTISVTNNQLENLAKLVENLSLNVEKLTKAMKAGVETKV